MEGGSCVVRSSADDEKATGAETNFVFGRLYSGCTCQIYSNKKDVLFAVLRWDVSKHAKSFPGRFDSQKLGVVTFDGSRLAVQNRRNPQSRYTAKEANIR